ncbi:MAG: hypothetical protein M1491_05845 [Deltaproteobacteria bacterium]|nr:hypothetical protein [Deltaproteobacteria bacterium]MCL5277074.1 hypothetical protein [Deltaproteobacteria bacterium]
MSKLPYCIFRVKDGHGWSVYASLFLLLLPVFLAFLYVSLFGVNGVFGDQWNIVFLFPKLVSGKLTYADLFAQHNEHRIFFPLIFMLLLGEATHYSNVVEMYVVVVLFTVSWTVLLWGTKGPSDRVSGRAVWGLIPVSFLLFTWRQSTNMLAGFQITYAFVQTFGLLSVCLVSRLAGSDGPRRRTAYLFFSILSAVIASFSSAMGLAVWIAGLLLLAAHRPKEGGKIGWPLMAWLAGGSLTWLVYFVGFHAPASTRIFHFLLEPRKVFAYFFAVCGGWSVWNSTPSMIAGFVTVSLFFACLIAIHKADRLDENLIWIGTGLFSLFTMGLITVGRYGYGTHEALSSRYVTMSVLMVIAVYALLVDLLMHGRGKAIRLMTYTAVFMIAISVPLSFFYGYHVGRKDMIQRERDACILYNYRSEPPELLAELYPVPQAIPAWADILKKLDYNVFYYRPRYVDHCDRIGKARGWAVGTQNVLSQREPYRYDHPYIDRVAVRRDRRKAPLSDRVDCGFIEYGDRSQKLYLLYSPVRPYECLQYHYTLRALSPRLDGVDRILELDERRLTVELV